MKQVLKYTFPPSDTPATVSVKVGSEFMSAGMQQGVIVVFALTEIGEELIYEQVFESYGISDEIPEADRQFIGRVHACPFTDWLVFYRT